jgi:hypothetical protein
MTTGLPEGPAADAFARIGLEHDGLTLCDVKRGDGEIWWCTARLHVSGLMAEKQRVSAHYAVAFRDLIEFFQQMARDWRGWTGSRVYESLEHDLRLAATHDGRHVRIAVTLEQSSQEDGWRVTAVVVLEPGEQLSQAADDVRALLSE